MSTKKNAIFLPIICIIFFIIPHISFAQQKWINGNIIIDNSEEIAEGVYVTNKRTKHTTRSNFTGSFFIQARVNDTLIFRSDWYENRNIVLKPALFKKEQIIVHLAITTINLSEALISKKLTGILEKDVVLGKKEDDVTRLYRLLNINPDVNPMKDTSALKAGLFNGDITLTRLDVGRIFDVFSGNLRKRKALIDFEDKAYKIGEIKAYYGENFFKDELGIPGYKINEFIETALLNTDNKHLLNNPNYFTIMNILRDYSKKYLDELFKSRIYKTYKNTINEKDLYLNIPLDSIPKD